MYENSLNNIKLTPLYDIHKSNSATMINFFGWKLPLYYTGIIQEHNHVRNHVGLFDISHMCRIEIDFKTIGRLEEFFPIKIENINLGCVRYSILLNRLGLIVDDLLIYRLSSKILLVVNASRKEAVNNTLSKIQGLSFKELSNTAHIALQGPKSAKIVNNIFTDATNLKFMEIKKFDYMGGQYFISRTGYTGEDGFEIIANKEEAHKIVLKFLKEKTLKLVGLGARDSLRLEAGLCLYGNEISEEINPVEAGISWVLDKNNIKLEKFHGANLIKKILVNGPKRKLYGFIVLDKLIARNGNEIVNSDGHKVGYVTSGCFSPSLNKSICMGLIQNIWDKNADLFVNIRNRRVKIIQSSLPFVKHKYHKKKDN